MLIDNLQKTTSKNGATNPPEDSLSGAMALNLAAWTESSARCYGVETGYTPSLWWRRPGGSGIYLTTLIHNAQTPDEELFADLRTVQAAWAPETIYVWDCWATRDLSILGYEQKWRTPWFLRPAGAITMPALPEGVAIESVTTADQLAEFEWASWEGFWEDEGGMEAELRKRQPFSQHAAATLDDPDMHYLVARLDGAVVAGVIAHVAHEMVGVYGLSTIERFRRRGYATALVRAAVALRPDLPVSVYPDPPTVPLYTGMGFVRAGEIAVWGPPSGQ
jgi:GNAT superfamily N-acetyltransferase